MAPSVIDHGTGLVQRREDNVTFPGGDRIGGDRVEIAGHGQASPADARGEGNGPGLKEVPAHDVGWPMQPKPARTREGGERYQFGFTPRQREVRDVGPSDGQASVLGSMQRLHQRLFRIACRNRYGRPLRGREDRATPH